MTMQTTREYHDAMRKWRQTLPFTDEELVTANRMVGAAAIHDLDARLYGKSGIFFNMGTVMYEVRRSMINKHQIIGFAKILVEHPGAILALLDDVQGLCFGEACMTKNIKVHYTAPHTAAASPRCG